MRRVVLALLLAPLAACGTNLLVVRWPVEVTGPDGSTLPLYVETRTERGMLQPDFDLPWYAWTAQGLAGLVFEPWDWVASTGAAVSSMFSDRARVAGGVVGWLAAFTPAVTLCEGMIEPGPRGSVVAGAETWRQIHDPRTQRDAAFRLWGRRILGVAPRDVPAVAPR